MQTPPGELLSKDISYNSSPMSALKAITPGKVHLFGEHSVVYGHTALLSAIGLYSKVEVRWADNTHIPTVHYEDHRFGHQKRDFLISDLITAAHLAESLWQAGQNSGDFQPLFQYLKGENFLNHQQSCLGFLIQKLNIQKSLSISIQSEIPTGRGLGSSASVSVALSHALTEAYAADLDRNTINDWAWELEKYSHGKPSGGDNSSCCFGGWIAFNRSQSPKIKPLNLASHPIWESFLLIDMGEPLLGTGELVQKVRETTAKIRDPAIHSLGRIAETALQCFLQLSDITASTAIKQIAPLMNQAQEQLSRLGVSTSSMDELCRRIQEKQNGAGIKLSGAGAGGMLLCLSPDPQELLDWLKSNGFIAYAVKMGVPGSTVTSL